MKLLITELAAAVVFIGIVGGYFIMLLLSATPIAGIIFRGLFWMFIHERPVKSRRLQIAH